MAIFPELKTACATVLVAVLLFSLVVLPVYRIWFSPLSKFPGPKLAAATLWYEFYYDVVLTGQYTFKIKDLHQKYGPIIRISPFELHIDDPEYYEVLYSNNLPLEKSSWYVQQFDIPGATFGTIDHKHHRLRRAAVNPFFSKQMINRLESTLRSNVDKLCSRLDEFRGTGQPLNMRPVYNALTTDITTLYAFNKSFGHFDSTDFKASWQETVNGALSLGSVLKQYPWLFKIIRTIPVNIVEWLSPTFKLLFAFENKVRAMTDSVLNGTFVAGKEGGNGLDTTIFHTLLESDLPPEEKSSWRLWQEAQSIVSAGSETTSNTLAVTHFHLLDNPTVLSKLRAELQEVLPRKDTPLELNTLEKLPYLTAVITEGLRISYGVSQRLPRIHPSKSMRYRDWEIPAGEAVGMTALHVHNNEAIFPNHKKFSPERWLNQPMYEGRQLERYMLAFGRGTRQCLGMNLAKAELYFTIAAIFWRFGDMELFETTRSDVDVKYDFFIPFPELDSKGVRVLYN